ncbi:MAG: hypothetical protein V1838_04485 [Patescibacteria group bacterium]
MNERAEHSYNPEEDKDPLLRLKDLRGDLHAHSLLSQEAGEQRQLYPLEKIAQYVADNIGAKNKAGTGIEYFAITEHTGRPLEPYRGKDEQSGKKILEQKILIDKLNQTERFHGLTILGGAEVNISSNGELDIADDVLKKLDIVIASRHIQPQEKSVAEKFSIYEKITKNPYVDILGHPEVKWWPPESGWGHEGWPKLIALAKNYDKAIEVNVNQINSYPDEFLNLLADSNVKISFGSDTHDHPKIGQDENLGDDWREFVRVTNRLEKAGIKKSQILNCLPLVELKQWREERIARFEK